MFLSSKKRQADLDHFLPHFHHIYSHSRALGVRFCEEKKSILEKKKGH